MSAKSEHMFFAHDGGRADVIVVGAGLAGLVAATRLQQAGVSTVVLEAAEQVGGRTRSQLVGGRILDVGGQLIGADYIQTRRLIASLGLHLRPDARLPQLRVHSDTRPELRAANLTGLDRLARQTRRWCSTLPPSAPWQATDAAELDRVSVAEWLDASDLGARATRLVRHLVGAFALAPAERLSLLHLLVWVAPAGGLSGLWRETRWSIRESAQEISRRLASRLAVPPVLDTAVTAVEQSNGHVTVHAADGRSWQSGHLALCVPLPATTAITFSPALPGEQGELLAAVASPAVTKLVASMAHPRNVTPMISVGDPLLRVAMRGKQHTLGFAYGKDATLPAERLRTHLLRELALTEDDIDDFTAYSWHEQSYALGGYPAFAPGQLSHHGPALRRRHGLIHFAGGDRSIWPGTMEGAVRDGQRVADTLLDSHRETHPVLADAPGER